VCLKHVPSFMVRNFAAKLQYMRAGDEVFINFTCHEQLKVIHTITDVFASLGLCPI
jgi:hypothetical protein